MRELELLLENFWIVKEQNREAYFRLKDASKQVKHFVAEKLGYHLQINPYLIKLEKIPGKAEGWMGIKDFDEKLDYAFLCLLLVFLEEKSAGQQFVLSEITEFIQAVFPGAEKVDWTLFRQRRSLVKVLKFAAELGLIKLDDGDAARFSEAVETEVLYQSTGLSRYFVRNFTSDITNYHSAADIEQGEWLDLDQDRGRVRRNRVYRRLIFSPVVYAEGAEDPDFLYIKNYRNMLQKDLAEVLDSELQVHKNTAFVLLNPEKHYKEVFPGKKAIADIVLQVNALIRQKERSGELTRNADDRILLSRTSFEKIIETCRAQKAAGWSKEYREISSSKLYVEVIAYMKRFNLITTDQLEHEIAIMPAAAKLVGDYPSDFVGGGSK